MAIPQSEKLQIIDDLRRALLTGALSISFEGRTVTYRSREEMQIILADAEEEAGLRTARPRTLRVAHDSGISRRERRY